MNGYSVSVPYCYQLDPVSLLPVQLLHRLADSGYLTLIRSAASGTKVSASLDDLWKSVQAYS